MELGDQAEHRVLIPLQAAYANRIRGFFRRHGEVSIEVAPLDGQDILEHSRNSSGTTNVVWMVAS